MFSSQGRRMKKLERGGTRTGESLLRARYNFKVGIHPSVAAAAANGPSLTVLLLLFACFAATLQEAFFLELRGDESAMRYYLAAYIALEEMTDTVDAQMINQVPSHRYG
jgi:hypothetical protein